MERLVAFVGMLGIIAAALLMSNNRKAINWKTVRAGLGLQFLLALLILKVPVTKDIFLLLGHGIEKLLDCAVDGAAFVMGDTLARGPFIFAIRVGASIVFIAALSGLSYYLGIMQKLVKLAARVLTKTMGITGPEAISSASAVFVGQVECQVLIKPYMPTLTQSELFCSITAAMATISGSALGAYTSMGMNPTHLIAASVMSAIGGIWIAKIFVPETQESTAGRDVELHASQEKRNVPGAIDALATGAMDGWRIALNVVIMVAVSVATMSLINGILGTGLSCFGLSWTVQDVFGVFFTPIAWLLGTPWHEAFHVGRLMATEILINEFASYKELSQVIGAHGAYELAPRTQMIATMALCGFANIGSIAINIGGLSAMVPERRAEIARLAAKALIAANFATWMTAAMAGLLF